MVSDNFPEDEIENELAPIAVQLAYVQQVILYSFLYLLQS